MRLISMVAALVVLATTAAFAGEPRFGQMLFSVENSTKVQTVFAPDTPAIVLHTQVLDMPKGTKLNAAWIAVKTSAAPPNYKIDAAGLDIDKDLTSDERQFSLSKPNKGWPIGDYKVELSINGKLVKSLPFTVAK